MWTRRLGDGDFEVCCIPFFAYDIALGDVVVAAEASGYLVESVRRRSGNGVLRVAVQRPNDVDVVHARLHDLLGRLEYLCEWFAPGYVAVNLRSGRSHRDLLEGVTRLGAKVEVERFLG